jgi:two-component system, NarL family, nitrate/nitrite response regulator NarL
MNEVRVLVVSEDPLVRSGLASLLSGQPGVVVEAQTSPDEMPGAAGRPEPEVAVWDAGASAASFERLVETPAASLRVLAVLADESQALEALGAGARGVVLRDVGASRLVAAVRAVAEGLMVLDAGAAESVLRPRPPASAAVEPLTPREQEVLQLLAQGLPNKLIAARLGISDHTVKFHVNAILGKLGAQSRTEALAQAARLGLVLF